MNRKARADCMGRKLFFLGWVLPLTLLAGCMVGPDFQRPEMPMAADWAAPSPAPSTAPTTRSSSAASQAMEITQWWQTFNDLRQLRHHIIMQCIGMGFR